MNFVNTGLIFTPEVLTVFKKVWGSRESDSRES